MLHVQAPEDVFVANVDIPERFRAMDETKVGTLADSMKEIGLMSPIHVRSVDDGKFVVLIAGRHRLEAARRLGWSEIQACFVDGDDDEFRLWEIAENLHRSELTPLERSEHIDEWIRLTEKKLAQLAPVSEKGGRGKEGGLRAATRDIGIERTEAQRATKIASIAPEAKQAARAAGIDTNQSALLKVAAAPMEEQVAAVEHIVTERRKRHETRPEPAFDAADAAVKLLREATGHRFSEVASALCMIQPQRLREALAKSLRN